MLEPMHNGIQLEYNGKTTQVHPLSWIPLEQLPGVRILADLAKDAEVYVKVMFRVVVRVNDYSDADDNNGEAAAAAMRPLLRDFHFRPYFADYTPLSFDMQVLCEDIREHVQYCAYEAFGRDRALYLQLGENEEIVCALDHPPDAYAASLEEVLSEGTNVHQRTVFCDVSFPGYNERGRWSTVRAGGAAGAAGAENLIRPSYYGGLPVV
jgi:hypothetical protein